MIKYKGLPLVRLNDIIYYGNPDDNYIVRIKVLQSNSENISTKLLLTLVKIQPDKSLVDKKSILKSSLLDSLELGFIWINRSLDNNS